MARVWPIMADLSSALLGRVLFCVGCDVIWRCGAGDLTGGMRVAEPCDDQVVGAVAQ